MSVSIEDTNMGHTSLTNKNIKLPTFEAISYIEAQASKYHGWELLL